MKPEHSDLFCALYQAQAKWLLQWAYRLTGQY